MTTRKQAVYSRVLNLPRLYYAQCFLLLCRCYETPGGTILRAAHVDLEGISMDREVRRLRDMISSRFSDVAYNGFWFSPEMDFILNAMKKSQEVRKIALLSM